MNRGGRFNTGTYVVTRPSPDAYVNGVRVDGGSTTFDLPAGVQPISGQDLKSVAEGEHADDYRAIFCEVELRTRSATSEADRIEIDGESFVIVQVKKRAVISDYWRAVATRKAAP